MKRTGNVNKERSVLSAAMLGIMGAVIMTFSLIVMMSAMISNESMSFGVMNVFLPGVQILSVFLGCIVTGVLASGNKAIACILTGGVYYLILVTIAMLFLDGISGSFWVGIVTTAVGVFGGIILSTREKASLKIKKRRRLHS